ncbi:helix-turn-helix transcriptional regulator [Virgibacillus halodenitrificans]|uniref:helix-turn-helix domain-containing protein n=1 Tax=Virgibacillus halodenitrificans TaxID=1482 RepID=UPI0024C06E06|nr:helix-turn-helix transcriptional regulator [Virgibacillus halodenitrificans]WHX28169.1 helix-turn-helix transcriptional regulator [Virgibacillus halodenitrificans]
MYIVKSNLKTILDARGMSIRQFAEKSGLKFETVRRLYNDKTVQYHRETLAAVCVTLGVGIDELLTIVEVEGTGSGE